MRLTGPHGPLAALGMTSLVQAVIGLFFGVIPVLGLPVSVFALLFGLFALLVVLGGPVCSENRVRAADLE